MGNALDLFSSHFLDIKSNIDKTPRQRKLTRNLTKKVLTSQGSDKGRDTTQVNICLKKRLKKNKFKKDSSLRIFR